jgi:hypothetical protein
MANIGEKWLLSIFYLPSQMYVLQSRRLRTATLLKSQTVHRLSGGSVGTILVLVRFSFSYAQTLQLVCHTKYRDLHLENKRASSQATPIFNEFM